MPHIYEEGPHMAMQDDPFTGTRAGDCIPSCLRVDSDDWPHAPLLRVPVYHHKRANCPTVTDLFELMELLFNGRRIEWPEGART